MEFTSVHRQQFAGDLTLMPWYHRNLFQLTKGSLETSPPSPWYVNGVISPGCALHPQNGTACNITSNCLLKNQLLHNNCSSQTHACPPPVSYFVHPYNEGEVASKFMNKSFQVMNLYDDQIKQRFGTVATHRATYYRHKIFVGSLARNTTPDELARFFQKFGKVIEAKVILDSDGNSKGYGFVSFASVDTVKCILSQGAIYMEKKRIAVASAIRKKYDDEE